MSSRVFVTFKRFWGIKVGIKTHSFRCRQENGHFQILVSTYRKILFVLACLAEYFAVTSILNVDRLSILSG